MTWRFGPKAAAVTTTSAPSMASRADAAASIEPTPSVACPSSTRAARCSADGSKTRTSTPGRTAPEDRQVAAALHARPDERGPDRPPGHGRGEVPDRDAGHGGRAHRGDRAAVHDRDRQPGRGVVEDHDRVDGRDPEGLVRIEAGDPLHPDEVVRAARRPCRGASRASRARTTRAGWDAGRSSVAVRHRRRGRSSSVRPGPGVRGAAASPRGRPSR